MKIYVDGLERSGNTFLAGAIGCAFGVNAIPLWDHSLDGIKNRDLESVFIVPLRDALPSLVSGMMYKKYATEKGIVRNPDKGVYQPIDVVIQRYKDYVDYLLENEDLFIAPFHEFTENHHTVTNVIAKVYGFEVTQALTVKEIIDAMGQPEEVDNAYMGNFPRRAAAEKDEARNFLLSNYKDEIDAIQVKINNLYERYYAKASL
jgi:hypothetical protein